MTASLSFQVDEIKDVLRIPNSALRFYPQRDKVRPEDRKLLEGALPDTGKEEDTPQTQLSAEEKAKVRKDHHRRHVWTTDGEFLRAIEVVTGISDNRYTQLVSGELKEGQMLVTGTQTAE
jgi:HlyD family secretion protein